MNWYEIFYSDSRKVWDVYKVTGNGQSYQLVHQAKTEKGAEGWIKRKNGWIRRR